MVVKIVKNRDALVLQLAELIQKTATEAISQNSVFNIGVSGGSTLTFVSEAIPKITTDFAKWKIFFCDERLVKEDNADSTYGVYKKALVDNPSVDLNEKNFVKIEQGSNCLPQPAATYEERLAACQVQASEYATKMAAHFGANIPRFDILLLGMGPDGHTCSLFPGHKLLDEKVQLVAPIADSPKPPPERITLTFPVINNAKNCVFTICGAEKAEMVKRILLDKEDLPAGRVKPGNGNLVWIVDEAAGELIKNASLN